MTLSPREVFLLGAAMGWVICACCFVLIPSWRYRDVRRLSSNEICKLLSECAGELQFRAPSGSYKKIHEWIDSLSDAERERLTKQMLDDE